MILISKFFDAVNRVAFEIAEDIYNYSNCHCSLCGTHTDREESEEETVEHARIEYAIESGKIYIYRVKYQLNRDEHGNEITARNETIDPNEEQQCR